MKQAFSQLTPPVLGFQHRTHVGASSSAALCRCCPPAHQLLTLPSLAVTAATHAQLHTTTTIPIAAMANANLLFALHW